MPNHFCLGQLAALEEAQDLVEERKWLPTSVSSGCCGPMSRFGFMAARHRCGTVEGDDFLRVTSWRGLRNKRMQAPVFGHVPSSRDVSDDACSSVATLMMLLVTITPHALGMPWKRVAASVRSPSLSRFIRVLGDLDPPHPDAHDGRRMEVIAAAVWRSTIRVSMVM